MPLVRALPFCWDFSLSLPRLEPSINQASLHLDRIHVKGPSPNQGPSPDAQGAPIRGGVATAAHRAAKPFQPRVHFWLRRSGLLSPTHILEKRTFRPKIVCLVGTNNAITPAC